MASNAMLQRFEPGDVVCHQSYGVIRWVVVATDNPTMLTEPSVICRTLAVQDESPPANIRVVTERFFPCELVKV